MPSGDALREEQCDEREQSEDGERVTKAGDARRAVGLDCVVGRPRADVRLVEGGLEVGVGDERHSAGELHLRIGLDPVRDRRALLDVRQEGRRERGDQERAGERGSQRGAEVGRRVLNAADLGALVVGYRGDRDGAELRRERADPEPDQQHRHEDDLRSGVLVEQGEEDDVAREQREEADANDEPRRDVGEQARDPDRGDEQRHRQRQKPRSGRQRRQAEADREVQRHDEEEAGLDEVLEEEHDQPTGQLLVPQHVGTNERFFAAPLAEALPAEEQPEHEQAARISQSVGEMFAHDGPSGFG